MVKNLPAMWEIRVQSLESGRSPGEGNGDPLQYSCLENPMDRGAWRATVHGVAESDTTEQLTHNMHLSFLHVFSWLEKNDSVSKTLSQCFTSEESNLDHNNS